MKKIALLVTMIILASCGEKKTESSSAGEPADSKVSELTRDPAVVLTDNDTIEYDVDPTLIEAYIPPNVALKNKSTAGQVTVLLHNIANYGQDEGFAKAAAQKLEMVLNSAAFKTAVTKTKFRNDEGLSGEQLYERIMKAHELRGGDGQDHVVDIRMRTMSLPEDGAGWMAACQKRRKPTIGKEGGKDGVMITCPNWVRARAAANDTASMAAHIAHEYMHLIGFSHPTNSASSVPYKVGSIVSRLINRP